jgi:isoleucyl-tRNA synthetase
VLHQIADSVIRLMAPILCHTADEAYLALHGEPEDGDTTVHTQLLPEPEQPLAAEAWDEVMALRDRALKHLEDARAQRGLDNPLDAGIEAAVPSEAYRTYEPFAAELADLCGVSRFELDEDGEETIVVHDLSDEPRCERSWKRDGTVKQRSDGGWLSDRDAGAVGVS